MAIPDRFEGIFGCGHEGTASLADVPLAKRLRRIDWLKTEGTCGACFAKKAGQRRKQESREAARWAAEHRLPPLNGSDKQIDFAESLRQDILTDAYTQLVESGRMSDEDYAEKIEAKVLKIHSARFWIDAQNTTAEDLAGVLDTADEVMAARVAEEQQLMRLEGSQKQVDWATRIRFDLLENAQADLVPARVDAATFDSEVLGKARKINSAHWWINQRDASTDDLLQLLADPGYDAIVENVEAQG